MMNKPKKYSCSNTPYSYLDPINIVQKALVKISEIPNTGESLLTIIIS